MYLLIMDVLFSVFYMYWSLLDTTDQVRYILVSTLRRMNNRHAYAVCGCHTKPFFPPVVDWMSTMESTAA